MNIVLLFFCIFFLIVIILAIIILTSSIKLNISECNISNFENGKRENKTKRNAKIYLEIYLFFKIKVAKIKLDKKF